MVLQVLDLLQIFFGSNSRCLDASVWDILLFSHTTKVVMLGYTATSVEIGDLPIVPANMRATAIFSRMKDATKRIKLRGRWRPKFGSGWDLAHRLMRVNSTAFTVQVVLATVTAFLWYTPPVFLKLLVGYLEVDPNREAPGWGWVYCAGLFVSNATMFLCMCIIFLWLRTVLKCSVPSRRPTVVGFDDDAASTHPCPAQLDLICKDTCTQGYSLICRIQV